MRLNKLPFEIICCVSEFFDTCEDVSNFRLTCRLFSNVRLVCNHENLNDPAHLSYYDVMYNNMQGPTLLHPDTKLSFRKLIFPFEEDYDEEFIICVVGKSKKLMKFVLNQLSRKKHVGGVVLGESERMMPLLKKYSPSQSFLPIEDVRNHIFRLKLMQEIQRQKNQSIELSYTILLEYDNHLKPHRDLPYSCRKFGSDFLLYLEKPFFLCAEARGQIDTALFKKTKKDEEHANEILHFVKQLIGEENMEKFVELYKKTFKTNLVLYLDRYHYVKLILVDITGQLGDSFLSDHIFWHHAHRKIKINED